MKVTERIGVEYQQWQRGEIVYISAPTGSGKTEFILDTLLDYAMKENRTILYLVNRHVLKEQLLERLDSKQHKRVRNGQYADIRNFICVETYQAIENKSEIDKNNYYIVADECQYGYCDSLFNPNTFLSYSLIISAIDSCRIFISATMERMEKYINNCIPDYIKTYPNEPFRLARWNRKFYEIKADYSHINLICLNDIDELEQTIVNEKVSKWLVFVDQKDNGKALCKKLQEKKCDAVYVDADSEVSSEAAEVIKEIIKKQKTQKRIVITTSVMDNGISIFDNELSNIVVVADTPEEFLQMLGRKRVENANEKINLYVMKKSLSEFRNRKERYIDRLLKAVSKFDIGQDYNCDEILRESLRSSFYYENISKFCFVYKNKATNTYAVTVNTFSYEQLLYLFEIYSEVIEGFKRGDDFAFLRMQAQWLGMTNVDEVIKNCIGRKVDINSSLIEKELERLYQLSQDNAELIAEMKNIFQVNRKITKEEIAEYKKKIEEKCKDLLNTSFVDGQIEYVNCTLCQGHF